MKDLIRRLTETYGPSGGEEPIRELIRQEIAGLVDDVRVDVLGNLIAKRSGDGAKAMVAAHMDEIGVVVTHIDEKGFLRFSNVGGVFPLNVLGQRVVFGNGSLGTPGEEKRDSLKDELKLEKMYIDIGARDRDSARKLVNVGDVACFQREFATLSATPGTGGERYLAKAFDDRIGCAVMIETLKRLKKKRNEVYFVFTVQEEVGVRGATTSTYQIDPDIGIAVDITGTGDTPEARTMAVELGKGAAIKVKDWGLLVHPQVRKLMVDLADRDKIPYQLEVLERGTTDAWAMHTSRQGVPSGVISIPTRYGHTPTEMIDAGDVESCVRLLTAILEEDLRKWGFGKG
jgi:endoglucanase